MMVGCRRPQAPRPPDLDEDNTPPPPLCHLAINPLPGNTALRIFFLMIAKKWSLCPSRKHSAFDTSPYSENNVPWIFFLMLAIKKNNDSASFVKMHTFLTAIITVKRGHECTIRQGDKKNANWGNNQKIALDTRWAQTDKQNWTSKQISKWWADYLGHQIGTQLKDGIVNFWW